MHVERQEIRNTPKDVKNIAETLTVIDRSVCPMMQRDKNTRGISAENYINGDTVQALRIHKSPLRPTKKNKRT